MVSRPPTDRQILDLQIAESCTARIVSFVAKCFPEKKAKSIPTVRFRYTFDNPLFLLPQRRKAEPMIITVSELDALFEILLA